MNNSTLHSPPSKLVVIYTPLRESPPGTRDLILLEQQKWGAYCGLLTRVNLIRYLRHRFFGEQDEDASYVNCCVSATSTMNIPIYVYELAPDVEYRLRTTIGLLLKENILQQINDLETVSFDMVAEASIRHPAVAVKSARWLAGPWTTGGVRVEAPALTVEERTVRAPFPLFGTVELVLDVRRWRHTLNIPWHVAQGALAYGWSEFVVGLPDGGRPVALEITPPPGTAGTNENADNFECGRGDGGGGSIEGPEDDEPTALPEDKHIRCEYCELECDDPDEKDDV